MISGQGWLIESAAPLWRAAVVDYPWEEYGGGGRGAQNHYRLQRVEDGPRIIRGSGLWRPHENAHLYMWATRPFLLKAGWLMEQLGFRYVTEFIWEKDQNSLGQYGLTMHESILFGVHGRGQQPDVNTGRRDIKSTFHWPVPRGEDGSRIHSRKPPEAYAELYEARSQGPFIEFFGRGAARPGWLIWGDEAHQSATAGAAHESA